MRLNQKKQRKNFDEHAKDLTPLDACDTVRMKPFAQDGKKWSKAMVTRHLDDRSYEVGTHPSSPTSDSSTCTCGNPAISRLNVPGYC